MIRENQVGCLAEEGEDIGLVARTVLELGGGGNHEVPEAAALECYEVVHVLDGHTSVSIAGNLY